MGGFVFRIFVVIGALQGIFPATNPWARPERLKFKYYHPIFLFSISLPILYLALGWDLIQNNPPKYLNIQGSTYASMIYYSVLISSLANAFFYQLNGLRKCRPTIQMCRMLVFIQEKLRTGSKIKSFKPSRVKYLLLCSVSGIYYAFVLVQVLNDGRHGHLNAYSHLPLRSSIFGSSHTSLLNFVICATKLLFRTTTMTVFSLLIIGGIWVTECQQLVYESILSKMEYFSSAQDTSLCFDCKSRNQFIIVKGDSGVKMRGGVQGWEFMSSEEYWELIQNLKVLYDLYSDVAGSYFLVVITSGILTFTVGLSIFLEQPGDMSGPNFMLTAGIFMGVSIILGEFMQNSIKQNQQSLKNRINFLSMEGKCPKSWKICCSTFTEWKWKSTARNVFCVDLKLIAGALGSIFTFTIFLFQVRTNEGTNCQ